MAVSQITPSLFLSGADGALNAALVSQKGITLIVNATLAHACPAYPGVECVRVPVPDLPGARLGDHFDRVADRIHGNRPGATLVHCAVGVSRSPALVMAYLMRYRGVTLRQAHRWVQERRPAVRLNAGFWEQLLQYERRLYGKNTVRVAAAPDTPPPTPRTLQMPRSPQMLRTPQMPRTLQMPRSPQMPRTLQMPRSPQTSRLTLVPRSPLMSRAPLTTNKRRRGTKSIDV